MDFTKSHTFHELSAIRKTVFLNDNHWNRGRVNIEEAGFLVERVLDGVDHTFNTPVTTDLGSKTGHGIPRD